MGRLHKVVAEALAKMDMAEILQRQWEQLATTLADDDKRALFREWYANK